MKVRYRTIDVPDKEYFTVTMPKIKLKAHDLWHSEEGMAFSLDGDLWALGGLVLLRKFENEEYNTEQYST